MPPTPRDPASPREPARRGAGEVPGGSEGQAPAADVVVRLESYLGCLTRSDSAGTLDLRRAHPELGAEFDALERTWSWLGTRFDSPRAALGLEDAGAPPGAAPTPPPVSTFLGGPIPSRGDSAGEGAGGVPESLARLARERSGRGRYREPKEIARGGMGSIQRVWDEDLRRHLVMKVMLLPEDRGKEPTGEIDPRLVHRFLEEAQVTGQLDHPSIVPVHDIGVDESGRIWFTMPLVQGEELGRVIELARAEQEGWTRNRLLNHLLLAMEAVAFAHSRKVIHRDLKPENIMVGRFGQTYVMDWGLARVVDGGAKTEKVASKGRGRKRRGDSSVTITTHRSVDAGEGQAAMVTVFGDLIGTPGYMAPEQARGEHDRVGPRSDVYSMGAILYQLLTGHRPFCDPVSAASGTPLLERILEGEPVPVRDLSPNEPTELVAIAERAMQPDPAARYASMVEMTEDLRAYLEGRVVSAYETGVRAEFKKWIQRNKLAAAMMGLVLLGGVLGALGFLWQQQNSLDAIAAEQDKTEEALGELEDAYASLEAQGEQLAEALQAAQTERSNALLNAEVANRNRAEAESERQLARISEALATRSASDAKRSSYAANLLAVQLSLGSGDLAEAARRLEACEPSLRGFEWLHLRQQLDMSLRTAEGHTGPVLDVALVPGRFLATVSEDRTLRLWAPERGREIARTLSPRPGSFASWTCLTASSAHGVLVAGRADGALFVYRPEPGEEDLDSPARLELPAPTPYMVPRFARFSPDSTRLVVVLEGDGEHSLFVLEAPGLDPSTAARLPDVEGLTCLAWHPGGERLSLGLETGEVVELDVSSRRAVARFRSHDSAIRDLAYSPDAELLLAGSDGGEVRVHETEAGMELLELSSSPVLALPAHPAAISALGVSRDGRRAMTAAEDGGVRLWDLETGDFLAELRGHLGPIRDLELDPTSDEVWTASNDGTLRAWLPLSGEAVSKLQEVEPTGPADLWFDAASDRLFVWLGREGRWWDCRSLEQQSRVRPLRRIDTVLSSLPVEDGFLTTSLNRPVALRENGAAWSAPGPSLPGAVLGFATDGTGTRVAFLYEDAEGTGRRVCVRDLEHGEWSWSTRLDRRVPIEGAVGLAFSHDGERLATAHAHGEVVLWEAANGSATAVLLPPAMQRSRMTARLLANDLAIVLTLATSGHQAWNWSPDALDPERGGRPVFAFHPSGEGIAVALGRRLYLWALRDDQGEELASPELAYVCEGHEGPITDLTYTPSGDRLVSGSRDRTLRVWEPRIGQGLVVFEDHERPIVAVAFDSRGERLAAMDELGLITIHETNVHELTVSARQRATDEGTVQIQPLLDELGEMGVLPDVRDVLFGTTEKTADVAKTIGQAAGILPTPARTHNEGWRVLREPGRSMDEYDEALRKVREAIAEVPKEQLFQRSKAVAELRLGRFNDSLATLATLTEDAAHVLRPEEVATRCMALLHLNDLEQAERELALLDEMLEDPFWAGDATARRFRAEARSLFDERALR